MASHRGRQRAAVTTEFKPTSSGPFDVVEIEVQKSLNANVGFAGMQQDVTTLLRGGATQAEFLIPPARRLEYLRPTSAPKKISGE